MGVNDNQVTACTVVLFSFRNHQIRETREAWMAFQRQRPILVPGTGARTWPNSRPAGRKYIHRLSHPETLRKTFVNLLSGDAIPNG